MDEEQAPELEATPGRDVFISYASHDKAAAESVCNALESDGLVCWIAPRDVVPGESFAGAIVHAIDATKVIVLVLSKHAADSQHVIREVERATSKRHAVIAFRLDVKPLPADFEYFLNTSQWLDASTTGVRRALPKLVEAVRGALVQTRAGPGDTPAHAVATAVNKRWRPALIGAVAILLVIVAYLLISRELISKPGTALPLATSVNHPVDSSVPAISDNSIAVLPFVDMSEKHDQEYFGDGMAEEILNLLVTIPTLKVIGRTSSFQFKGKADDLRKIGAVLRVAYVVEGSVRRSGDHIRVTAQLIDAHDGTHRWSETYDRDVSDVLKVQGEIAKSLVRALQLEVNASGYFEQQAVRNGEAYDSYLRGLHAWNRFDQSGFEEAAVDFRHALDVDPSFALAAEELARTLQMESLWGFVPPQKGFEQARAAAEAALRLNPKSALAHAVLGSVYTVYDFDWPAAERELKDAMALAPTNPQVLIFAADKCLAVGRWNEAARLMDAASAADPLHAGIYEDRGEAYLRLGRLPEAENSARRVVEITPTYAWGYYGLAVILLIEGKVEAALAEVQKETSPDARLIGLALIYQAMHRTRDADAAFARFKAEYANDLPMEIAKVYAMRGQMGQAFSWLDKAYTLKDPDLWLFKGHPLLKNLEQDPRYKAFLRKMKLPD